MNPLDSLTGICLIFAGVMGALFGFIYLIDRRSKSQERSGKPSRLIRVSAIVVGLLGIALEFWLGWPLVLSWFLIPVIILLLGYGLFGLFGSVNPPADKSQGKK